VPENLELYVPNELSSGLQRFEFRFDGDQFAGPDFRIRYGRDSQGTPVAQKIAHGGQSAYELLQREVSTGRVLVQHMGQPEYPACLSRLIGYNPGTAENLGPLPPYAVFTYQRKTLADLTGELPLRPEAFRAVADGLIIALCYLKAAHVVHRHIRMETVHWDGLTVQLADFSHAAGEWEDTPGAFGEAPWDAPEQRAGAASADCRDDVYAAALLLARLATGQVFADDEEAREAIARMDLTQQHLLQDAAAEYRRDRPAVEELLKRRNLSDPIKPELRASRGRESEARARFAALRQRQRAALRARSAAPWHTRLPPPPKETPMREWWVKPGGSAQGAGSRQPAGPDTRHGTSPSGPAWPSPPR
jgi:serine/threonine protein kinase